MTIDSRQEVCQLNQPETAKARVLFLGYGAEETKIVNALMDNGCEVWHTAGKISSTKGYDLAISFGYRHILTKNVIHSSSAPIINLHISYLPYNRGAHPNFWSFFEGTPSGVSIHLIDEGIDTGPLLYQRYANFPKNARTFAQTYAYLIELIEQLFVENIQEIITQTYRPKKQRHKGTYHRLADLPAAFSGWNADIDEEIEKLDQRNDEIQIQDQMVLSDMEKIHRSLTAPWMGLIRLALSESPSQAKELFRQMHTEESKLAELFAKLSR